MRRLVVVLAVGLVLASGCAGVELRQPWTSPTTVPLRVANCGPDHRRVVAFYELVVQTKPNASSISDLDPEVFRAFGINPFTCVSPGASTTPVTTAKFPRPAPASGRHLYDQAEMADAMERLSTLQTMNCKRASGVWPTPMYVCVVSW